MNELALIIQALQMATQLFPLVVSLVHQAEALAPNAPGAVKLNTVLTTVQSSLTAANATAQTVAQVTPLVTGMITGIKAQYNAGASVVQVPAQ